VGSPDGILAEHITCKRCRKIAEAAR
jgi:hypothetical protein